MESKKFEEGHPNIFWAEWGLDPGPFYMIIPVHFRCLLLATQSGWWNLVLRAGISEEEFHRLGDSHHRRRYLNSHSLMVRGWVCFDMDFLFLLPLPGDILQRDLMIFFFFWSAFIWRMTWWFEFYHYYFDVFWLLCTHIKVNKENNGETALFKIAEGME